MGYGSPCIEYQLPNRIRGKGHRGIVGFHSCRYRTIRSKLRKICLKARPFRNECWLKRTIRYRHIWPQVTQVTSFPNRGYLPAGSLAAYPSRRTLDSHYPQASVVPRVAPRSRVCIATTRYWAAMSSSLLEVLVRWVDVVRRSSQVNWLTV